MKYLAIALLLIPALFAFTGGDPESGTRKRLPAGCILRSSIQTKGVSKLQTKCQFTFKTTANAIITDSIRYSHNGINGVLRPDANGIATVLLPYGTTRFQFLYTTNYYEIYSDTIHLQGGHVAKFDVLFDDASSEIICDKPVIYVYPDATTQVNIQLNVQGEFLFTYPTYYIPGPNDSATPGWNFTADPYGSIHMNGKEYDYLFWDGKIEVVNTFNLKPTGFIVQRDSLVTFFEEKLTAMNLNPREQQDFITYWVPRMQKNEMSYVRFVFNEGYDQFASINVTPQPQNIFRVMMVWQDATEMETIEILPQTIPSAKRDGFTVIEWGGTEVSAQLAIGSAQ